MQIRTAVAVSTAMSRELLCNGLRRHRRYFTVIGAPQTTKELLKLAAELRPDVAVISLDFQGDPRGGLNALRELHVSASSTRSILLPDSSEPNLVIDAFSAGARGLLCTNSSFELLCKCIRCVHAGQIWADSNQLECVVKALENIEPTQLVNAKGIPMLTRREEQIVSMVVEGLRNAEISSKLDVSAHTVKNHLFHVYEKLGISNRVELILYAVSRRFTPRTTERNVLIDCVSATGLPPPTLPDSHTEIMRTPLASTSLGHRAQR